MADEDDELEKLDSPENEGLSLDASDSGDMPTVDNSVEAPPKNEASEINPEENQEDIEKAASDLEPKQSPAEDDGLESSDDNGLQAQLSPHESRLKKYQDFMDEYKRLQQHRRNTDLVSGLMTAGGQIGQSMAGKFSGNFTPDLSGAKAVQEIGNRPVTDFEQGQVVGSRQIQLGAEKDAHDPASPQSIMVRDYLNKRLGLNLADDVSAADAQMLLKTVGRPGQTKYQKINVVNQKTGEKGIASFNPSTQELEMNGNKLNPSEWVQDYRSSNFVDPKTGERVGFSAGTGKTTGALTGPGVNAPVMGATPSTPGGQVDLNRSFLNAQQAKQVDHAREKFIQEVKDDRNSLNANDRVIQVLQAGGELGDLPREIQDQLNRAFGQKGHISDAQLGGLLGKPDWKNRVENAVSLGTTGKLTDENRQFLLDVANLIKEQNQSYIDKKSDIYTQNLYGDLKNSPNLSKYKFGPDSVKGLLGVESAVRPGMQRLKEKQSGRIVPIKPEKYDAALKSGLFEKVQ